MTAKSRDELLEEAEQVFKKAFEGPRDPRSDAYQRGVMAALIYRFAGTPVQNNNPYKAGTAEFDAFISATDEGYRLWRHHRGIGFER